MRCGGASAVARSVRVVSSRPTPDLSAIERDALVNAAAWYAKYRAHDIAADASDTSLAAATERERYLALISALGKFGVRVALPDELTGWGADVAA